MEASIFQKEHPHGHVAQGELTQCSVMGNQSMNAMLSEQYAKYWQVHCAKPHKKPKKDIEYLGRYIKRPAIANSRLVHYNRTALLFNLSSKHRILSKIIYQMIACQFLDEFRPQVHKIVSLQEYQLSVSSVFFNIRCNSIPIL